MENNSSWHSVIRSIYSLHSYRWNTNRLTFIPMGSYFRGLSFNQEEQISTTLLAFLLVMIWYSSCRMIYSKKMSLFICKIPDLTFFQGLSILLFPLLFTILIYSFLVLKLSLYKQNLTTRKLSTFFPQAFYTSCLLSNFIFYNIKNLLSKYDFLHV